MACATRLRAAGRHPADLIAPAAQWLGCDPGGVRREARSHLECHARALVVHVACDGVGVTVVEMSQLPGIIAPAVSAARRRGARLLAELGWRLDDVVSWSLRPW